MERLEALGQEHGLEPSGEDHYRYAEAWEAAGEPQRAMAAAVRYLRLQGREAEHYIEALELMNRAESGKPPPASSGTAGAVDPAGPEPACAGQAQGASCWMALANQPGCHVWDNLHIAGYTVTWTGECDGGLASGSGNLKWVRGSEENEHTGRAHKLRAAGIPPAAANAKRPVSNAACPRRCGRAAAETRSAAGAVACRGSSCPRAPGSSPAAPPVRCREPTQPSTRPHDPAASRSLDLSRVVGLRDRAALVVLTYGAC